MCRDPVKSNENFLLLEDIKFIDDLLQNVTILSRVSIAIGDGLDNAEGEDDNIFPAKIFD